MWLRPLRRVGASNLTPQVQLNKTAYTDVLLPQRGHITVERRKPVAESMTCLQCWQE